MYCRGPSAKRAVTSPAMARRCQLLDAAAAHRAYANSVATNSPLSATSKPRQPGPGRSGSYQTCPNSTPTPVVAGFVPARRPSAEGRPTKTRRRSTRFRSLCGNRRTSRHGLQSPRSGREGSCICYRRRWLCSCSSSAAMMSRPQASDAGPRPAAAAKTAKTRANERLCASSKKRPA